MQFTLNVKELFEALDVVGVITPSSLVGGVVGYRFVVHDGVCSIYSRDGNHVTRAQIKTLESDGDVDMIYPTVGFQALRALTGSSTVTIACKVEEDRYTVDYVTDRGATDERTSTNPKFLAQCDDDYNSAQSTVAMSSGVLRLALSMLRGHLATESDRVDDMYQTLQIFDASKPEWEKGNGVMFAADAIRAAYFDCAEFKDKHLPIHAERLASVMSFLSKIEGPVSLRHGEHMMFFEDKAGHILGIMRNVKIHPRYSFFPLEKDSYIFRVDKDIMQQATTYLRTCLNDKTKDKVRFAYDHEKGNFFMTLSESSAKSKMEAIPIKAREFRNPESFCVSVNVDQLRELFNTTCNEVEFRVALVQKGSKTGAIFRTIDHFWVDPNGKVAQDNTQEGVVECKVTRLMPSKD